ncbi:unnamed protein product [Symbiodinium sp. CCMP2592]|nr:unnamed protein product [Symbiodinium sp. CCMP2592]
MKKPAAVKAVGKVLKPILKKPSLLLPVEKKKAAKKDEEKTKPEDTTKDEKPPTKNNKQSKKEPSKEEKNDKKPKKEQSKEQKNDKQSKKEPKEKKNDKTKDEPEKTKEKFPLSLTNIRTHSELLEVKGWSGKEMVWKLFEKGRQKEGCDASYRDQTSGAGGNKRKQDMLTSWLLDEGKCGKYYQKACLQLTKMSSHQVQVTWEPWKTMQNRYGKTEALARLKAGTMKWRRSKTDSNFLEFANVHDKESEGFEKKKSCSVQGPDKKVGKNRALALDKLTFEELQDMEQVKEMKIDPDLKSVITKMNDDQDQSSSDEEDSESSHAKKVTITKKKKTKRTSSSSKSKAKSMDWEKLSQIEETDNKSEFNKKLTLFKSELQKEETFFEMLLLESKLRKNEKKDVQQNLEDLSKTLKQVGSGIENLASKDAVKKSLLMALKSLKASKNLKKNLAVCKETQTKDKKLKRQSSDAES